MKTLTLCLFACLPVPGLSMGAGSDDLGFYHDQPPSDSLHIAQLLVQIDTLLSFDYAEAVLIYDYPEAVKSSELALRLSRQAGKPRMLAQALTKRAKVHWFNGEYPPSIKLNNEAIRLRTVLKDSAGLSDNFHAIAMNFYYTAHYDSAISYYNKALAIHTALHDLSRQRLLLNHLALVYYKICQYNQVIYYTQEAEKLAAYSATGEPVIAIAAPKNVYRDDVYYRSVVKEQFEWLKKEKNKRKVSRDLILVLRNIAFTYQQLASYDSTLMYFHLADQAARRLGIIPYLIDHGNAFRAAGNPDSAIHYYQKAIKETRLRGTQIHLHWAYQMISDAYNDKGEHEQALTHALASLHMNVQMNNRHSAVGDFIRVAETHFAMAHLAEARNYAEEGLKLSRGIKTHAHSSNLYQLLSRVSAAEGSFRQAYDYQRKYEVLSDSIESGESDLTLAELQVAYEANKNASEIAQLNAANKVQEAQLKNRNVLITSGIIGFVLMTALAIVGYVGYQNKQKANRSLQQTNHEKNLLLGEIHHRVKNNLQVISSILNLQSRKLSDLGAKDAILDGRNRVKAMALIHQQLYQNDQFASIQVKDYLKILIDTISESFGYREDQYTLDYQADNIELDVDSAIHIGLIVNEVVSNVFKHAFQRDAANHMTFGLSENEGVLQLEISDNGSGYSNPTKDNTGGFGMYLVENLVKDMDGDIEIEKHNGTEVKLRLRSYQKAPANIVNG